MILGLVEHDGGVVNDLAFEMLTVGRQLAGRLKQPLEAVLIGAEARPLADRLAAYGVLRAHLAEHDGLSAYAPMAWAQSLVELIDRTRPEVVMAAGSDRGNEVMAHLAARRSLSMAANCTEIRPGDPYQVTRLRWGGSLLEDARLHGPIKLLTIAPHAVVAEETPSAATPPVDAWTPALDEKDFRVRVARRVEPAAGKISLAQARVVVGGGRGVGSAEGFATLDELADLLGGTVGCSRAVTSLGWRPHSDQVGLTGARIAPELYIACGISGAIQHMVGCRAAKHILAINTDPDAPIVAQADYAVIGDVHKVVAALSAEIKAIKTRPA